MENKTNNIPDGSGQTLEYLEALVVQGLRNLQRKWESPRKVTRDDTWAVRAVGVNSSEILFDRLHSNLLPLFKDQVSTILNLLGDASMKEEPKLKLRRALEIQPEIDYSITQIHSTFLDLCPESLSATTVETNDQHLKHLKAYRLLEFKKEFDGELGSVCSVFGTASEFLELRKYPDFRRALSFNDDFEPSESTSYCIELIIKNSKRSEMDAIEEYATGAVRGIDGVLANLIGLINPAAPQGYDFPDSLNHQPMINLATTAIPFIKLLKLFFKKLSKHGIMNCQRLPPFTQMNSYQLKRFCQSAENVAGGLGEILYSLAEGDKTFGDRPVDIQFITDAAEESASKVVASLLSVLLYLVPLIDSLPEKNYFQGWFATWNTQINVAVRNFVQVAKDLRHEHNHV
ncbi:hypothetical protein PTTG_27907 [Puccinia triticina 1-1 BBBD Race 1]|uniref:Uncharacterized protein n=1 Tax=Puccinia triticina (isolate 1-1 / race 1 (BBBD)) TaxID=630390 RepID=A0A180GG44_PUCT1|nr:hypothetical protein PTTG_27907 [Puccinia triticina 1-1 BBBD Race 1]WAR58613.1 hypothetical protein PtB15_5B848 [Puccinia triticina]